MYCIAAVGRCFLFLRLPPVAPMELIASPAAYFVLSGILGAHAYILGQCPRRSTVLEERGTLVGGHCCAAIALLVFVSFAMMP